MYALTHTSSSEIAQLIERETPKPTGHDVLISIEAVAVNPVDLKVQSTLSADQQKILGWDACGIVTEKGELAGQFKIGDRVFYAGNVARDGSFASHQLVDERLIALAPTTLNPLESASLPLVSLTAWELLFNRLRLTLRKDIGKTLLVIGAAGGVGSILIPLARQLLGLNVIATASSAQSTAWCETRGAHHVISHKGDLKDNYQTANLPTPDYIICLANSDDYYAAMAELIAPQGLIGVVVNFEKPVDLNLLKTKSAGLVWEFMFTRPLLQTDDQHHQQKALQRIAELVDTGYLEPLTTHHYDSLTAEHLQQAHTQISTGHTYGKIALGPLTLSSP